MIPRQDSQTSGIVGHAFGEAELGREIGKDSTGRFGVRAPEPAAARLVVLQTGDGAIQFGEKCLIGGEFSQAPLANPAEDQTRIMVRFLPKIRIETFEYLSGGMIPSPAQV